MRGKFSAEFQCKVASGIHDISLLFNMECDADTRKNSYAIMLSGGTALFQGIGERDEGTDGVGSIRDEFSNGRSTRD